MLAYGKNEFVILTIQVVILVAILSYKIHYFLSIMDLWIINSSTIELITPASLSQCEYHNNFVCSSFQWIIIENLY